MPLAAGDSGHSPSHQNPGRGSREHHASEHQGLSLPEFLLQPVHAATPPPTLVPLPPLVPPAVPSTAPASGGSSYLPPAPSAAGGYMLSSGQSTAQYEDSQAEEPSYGAQLHRYNTDLHARAVGSDVQGPHLPGRGVGVGDVKRMTWEQYNALTPQAKAAVDFNTMLVKAVHKDLHHQDGADAYDPSKQQKATYNEALDKMFGDDGGSETYAPQTLGLLRRIGFHDDTADLDEFLNLNAAITARDIRHSLTPLPPMAADTEAVESRPVWSNPPTEPTEIRTDMVQTLANRTQDMEKSLAKGNALLQSMPAMVAADLNGLVANPLTGMGGIASNPKPALGFGPASYDANGQPTDLNTYFQQAFGMLADKKSNLTLDSLQSRMSQLPDPHAFEDFLTYANQRAGMADRFDVSLTGSGKARYRTPEEYMKLLGLDK